MPRTPAPQPDPPSDPPPAPLAAAEFFAGMGLVRRALEAPGRYTWRTVFANDHAPSKQRLYAASFDDASEVFRAGDIGALSAADVPAADLWTASFPCTDLSLAGRGKGIHAGESSAVWHLLRLLEETPDARRPRRLLFENVLGLLSSHGGADFRALVGAVNALGYGVEPVCVNASHFVPQSRARMFLVCERCAPDDALRVDPRDLAPSPARPARLLESMRAAPGAVWHARELPPLPKRRVNLTDILEDPPEDSARWWSRERCEYFLNQVHPSHQRLVQRMISASEISYAPGFRRVRAFSDDPGDPAAPAAKRSVVELRADGLAGCLRTPKGGSAKQIILRAGRGAFRVRHMTPAECARLQGVDSLPDSFNEFGDNENLFALGDAVCIPAVRWVLDLFGAPAAAPSGGFETLVELATSRTVKRA